MNYFPANITAFLDRSVANPTTLATDRLDARYRARDFGIGFGRSSGYARTRSYVDRSPRPLFRVG